MGEPVWRCGLGVIHNQALLAGKPAEDTPQAQNFHVRALGVKMQLQSQLERRRALQNNITCGQSGPDVVQQRTSHIAGLEQTVGKIDD